MPMVWATNWKWMIHVRMGENILEAFDQTSVCADIYGSDGGDNSAVYSAQ